MDQQAYNTIEQSSSLCELSSHPEVLGAVPSQAENIPSALLDKMEEAITHYPVSKRSAALPLLHLWQNHFSFIDESGINWIAEKLELNSIAILELVTFYPWFRQKAPGKTIIRVCRTLSCALAGSYEVHEKFCKSAGIDSTCEGHHEIPTSPDGKFSVEFVECLASCGSAPVCLVNKDLVERVSLQDAEEIIKKNS
jgi:NADH-quinone oxidoreductase subunit E